jgi:hypothetical protein
VHPDQETPMNEDRTVVAETPTLSHWDVQDDELDRAAPARAFATYPSVAPGGPKPGAGHLSAER